MNMQLTMPDAGSKASSSDRSIGRIVSVTGSKAIVMLDSPKEGHRVHPNDRPDMGTLLGIDTANTVVLAIISALSAPVPAQREGDAEIWIAELGLVGELWRDEGGRASLFARGVTVYPALGDRVRVAFKSELEAAFCGDPSRSVRIGCIRQDSTIPAMVRVDELLGKHLAILGTTGTGKSCTTALILRAILEKNPAAHIVLLDPHNEYATAFSEFAEVISPRNMQLPFWLLNFEEIVEVLIADNTRKAEIEILQELIPIAKARYSAGRARDQQTPYRRGMIEPSRFTIDTPVPYRISDLTGLIDERMGKLENKKDLSPYRQLRSRIDNISQDGRYSFMFGSLTVYDGMTQVLSRIFRVPVNNRPITIVELTGLPTEIINVVVSVLSRMTFDFAHWSEGKVPLTLVCEEAHRYVPAAGQLGFEPCKRAIAKIAKEGRKYGVALCIVSQRPAEIDPTILSQCNTVFALRMSNDRDQEIVNAAITDTGSGLLEFLPALGQREALAFGDGVALPVRIKFDELPSNCLPRSTTAHFTEHWQRSVGDEGFLEQVVEKWRSSDISAVLLDPNQQAAMLATDNVALDAGAAAPEPHKPSAPPPPRQESPFAARVREADVLRPHVNVPPPGAPAPGRAPLNPARPASPLRKDTFGTAPANPPPQRAGGLEGSGSEQTTVPGAALKSLRDRLIQRQQR